MYFNNPIDLILISLYIYINMKKFNIILDIYKDKKQVVHLDDIYDAPSAYQLLRKISIPKINDYEHIEISIYPIEEPVQDKKKRG